MKIYLASPYSHHNASVRKLRFETVCMAAAELMEQGDIVFSPISHNIFGIVSDGDLMEGISNEAASFAGHHKLDNIIYIYDDNSITIDGNTNLTFSDDIPAKFEAIGWHTVSIDGHNHEEIAKAIQEGIDYQGKPTLIAAKTHIAFGSPNKQDSASSHGAPLGEDEVKQIKEISREAERIASLLSD